MEVEAALRGALRRLHWRLKAPHFSRLATDLLAIFIGLRPLVMVDYLPRRNDLPEMLDYLAQDIFRAHSGLFPSLRIMHIEECIYLFDEASLQAYMNETSSSSSRLKFVLLDSNEPRFASEHEVTGLLERFKEFERLLTRVLSAHTARGPIDLLPYLRDISLAVPTLNGWLLSYPVTYVFAQDQALRASRYLSSEVLHLYQLFVDRGFPSELRKQKEVLSFTVPARLSRLGLSEPWAEDFVSSMWARVQSSVPTSLRLILNTRSLQSVAF